jgi:hypothetical protein
VVVACLLLAPSASAQSLPGSCQFGASLICAAQGATDLLGGAAQQGLGVASDAVTNGIAGWAASGATWLLRTIGQQIDQSSRPALASSWFSSRYASMRQIAIALSVIFLLLAIAHAALRHDLQQLIRSCLVALPAALLLMFAVVTLVELALALTDELSAAALGTTGQDARKAFADLGAVLSPAASTQPALPAFVIFVAAILTTLLSLLVWLELVLREAAVYLAVAFLPLALAAAVWPRTVHWAQRLAGWLGALILAKLTIATAFSLAGAMLAGSRSGSGGLSALLAGCAVLVLAAASPWMLLRLIPFTAAAGDGMHRREVASAARQAPGVGAALLLARHGMHQAAASPADESSEAGTQPGTWAPAGARESEPDRA